MGIVDFFEVIEVDNQSGERCVMPTRTRNSLLDHFQHVVAVVQAGELVVHSQLQQTILLSLQCNVSINAC